MRQVGTEKKKHTNAGAVVQICDCQRLAPYVFAGGAPPPVEDRIDSYEDHGNPFVVVAAVASLVVKARSRLIKMKREGKSHEDHHEQFIGEGRVEDPEKVRVDPVKVNTPYEIALQYKTLL